MSNRTMEGKSNGRVDFKDRDNTLLTLDELLSPKALDLLNKQGFVCFKIQDERGEMRGGWISRKTKTFVELEEIVFNTMMDPT